MATVEHPLIVRVRTAQNQLMVSNNLQEIPLVEDSNGLGLLNLNERFKIMMSNEIEIQKTNTAFIVKLPLNNASH